ncbi:MAG: hypothetical protein AB7T31_04120 [Gemmatimonadales bacterium]
MRALFSATLAFAIALPATAQQTPPDAATQPPAQPMMGCMHMQAGGGMAMQGMPMMQGMQHGAEMQPAAAGDAASAIFGQPVGALALTAEQATELDAIVARAREAALAILTPEQRARLSTQAAEHPH